MTTKLNLMFKQRREFFKRNATGGLFVASLLALCAGNENCPGEQEKNVYSIPADKDRDVYEKAREFVLSQLAAALLDIQAIEYISYDHKIEDAVDKTVELTFDICKIEPTGTINGTPTSYDLDIQLPTFMLLAEEIKEVSLTDIDMRALNWKWDKESYNRYNNAHTRALNIIKRANNELSPKYFKIWHKWSKHRRQFYSWMMEPAFDEVAASKDKSINTSLHLHTLRFNFFKKLIDPKCEIAGLENYSPNPKRCYKNPISPKKNSESDSSKSLK